MLGRRQSRKPGALATSWPRLTEYTNLRFTGGNQGLGWNLGSQRGNEKSETHTLTSDQNQILLPTTLHLLISAEKKLCMVENYYHTSLMKLEFAKHVEFQNVCFNREKVR